MNIIEKTFWDSIKKYGSADFVIFGAPLIPQPQTVPGTRYASRSMRTESQYGMESYSPYQEKDFMT
jgi:agmatinase